LRRADRLFQIIQFLRRRGVITAARLAEELEVSERTIYRDVRDLMLAGVPIEGEAGVGYALRRGYDLPPLMFTEAEIQAMVLGARTVTSWADPALAKAAQEVLAKVEAVVPDRLKERIASTPLFAPGYHTPHPMAERLGLHRTAIDQHRKVRFGYTRADGVATERTVRPVGLFFWGTTWSMVGWCELRESFRNFRLDRMEEVHLLGERFADDPGRTLQDYLAITDEAEHSHHHRAATTVRQ
jgi:predicted DNA-binding transcriptional regulator YafY